MKCKESDIRVIRAREDLHKKYIKNFESLIHNTSFIAIDNEEKVLASGEFMIVSLQEGEFTSVSTFHDVNLVILIEKFIDEFLYWNPFIKRISYQLKGDNLKLKQISAFMDNDFNKKIHDNNNRVLEKEVDGSVEIFKIKLKDIQPAQLTISSRKLERIGLWVKKPEDIAIPIIDINGRRVSIDGHTRLLQGFLNGFDYVYAYYEIEDYDEDMYKTFLSWCYDDGVYNISDLKQRVISDDEHDKLWIQRCQNYIKTKNIRGN